jgi:DNA-binding transcriptional LysR family regulator
MMNDARIDFRLVEALATLIAERSVTRAADRLDISQPAMSHILSKPRKIFVDPILTRGRDGLVPTARALELEITAREILWGVARLTAPRMSCISGAIAM